MKRTIIVFIFLLLSLYAKANEIDKLKTVKDVEQFLEKNIDTNRKYDASNRGKIVSFFKADFDYNGSTDLIVKADSSFCVINFDDGYYFDYRSDLIDIIYVNNEPLLIWNNKQSKRDTTTFKFGGLIEYQNNPDHVQIKEIIFKSDDNWDMGADFELRINAKGSATYKKGKSEIKRFEGTIDRTIYDMITQTINYLRLESYPGDYPLPLDEMGSDLLSYELEITFSNGKTRKIKDYGGPGSQGLMNLYQQLLNAAKHLPETK